MLEQPISKPSALGISLALHVGVFFALMSTPEIKLPVQQKSEYQLAIAGKEQKLVWYRFKKDLPKVSPAKARTERRPARVVTRAKQQMIASPVKAPERKQMVFTPAPELPPQTPPDSPNILAMAVKLPTRPFVAPVIPEAEARKVDLPADAPALRSDPLQLAELQPAPKMTKRFVPPPKRVPKKLAEVELPANVPEVAADVPEARLDVRMKLPTRPFSAPVVAPAANREVDLPGAPPEVAVVGLNPSELPAPLPVAPSPARFAAGPEIRRKGAEPGGDRAGLMVPDLSVGGKAETRLSLLAEAYAAPTSERTMREALRLARKEGPIPAEEPLPARSGAARVSSAPDPRFNGRDIYMMAIQMPNLTSYSGSWLMWYADRTAHSAGLSPISPPVAHRKVDPKYVASAAADRIEGKIQLACVINKEGLVSNVEIVKGLDPRLNASAVEALGKWQFFPAIRDGEPVDVDVLVEIPFTLAPPAPVPY